MNLRPGESLILEMKAKGYYNIYMEQSVLIGDRQSGIEAGIRANVGQVIHVLSEDWKREREKLGSDMDLNGCGIVQIDCLSQLYIENQKVKWR